MDDGYSWQNAREGASYRLPGPNHLGWWIALAFCVAVVLHIVLALALGRLPFGVDLSGTQTEVKVDPITVEKVAFPEDVTEAPPRDFTPERIPQPKPEEIKSMIDDIDTLTKLKDAELEMKPDILKPEFNVQLGVPAAQEGVAEGVENGIQIDLSKGIRAATDMVDVPRNDGAAAPAIEGPAITDATAVMSEGNELAKFSEELLKKGAGGVVSKGLLEGGVALDDMLGLPADVLVNSKTFLPSDLLFEYNSDQLRESARNGLMKLAMVIDRHPKLYCWVDGYTDLIGGEDFNRSLSQRRADAVKKYLVQGLGIPESRIISRGFGKANPLIGQGSIEEQSPNRRVEIKMRKSLPEESPPEARATSVPPAPAPASPPRATPAAEPVVEPAPQPQLIKPKRALPVEDAPQPQRALPVEEKPQPQRALPVEEPPLRADPVPENNRAVPIPEVIEEP